jgi:hypothetical protein
LLFFDVAQASLPANIKEYIHDFLQAGMPALQTHATLSENFVPFSPRSLVPELSRRL